MPRYRVTFSDAPFAWAQVQAATPQDAEWAVYADYAHNMCADAVDAVVDLDFGEVVRIEEVPHTDAKGAL
jgi:hypothetical protein